MWLILIIIIVIIILSRKNDRSERTSNTYGSNSINNTNNLAKKEENMTAKQQNIETLDSGEGVGGVPDFYTWNDLIPEKILIKSKVSLDDIQNDLSNVMKTKNYEVEFRKARIKYGGFLSHTYEDCLIMSNPNAPTKYFDFIFTSNLNGGYSVIRSYRSVFSYNNHWINELQSRKNESDNVNIALNFIDNAMNKRNIKEYEDGWTIEYLYYTAVQEAVKEIFGI